MINIYNQSYRLAFGLVAAFLVWLTPYVVTGGQVPAYYFILLISLYMIHQVKYLDKMNIGITIKHNIN